jgi:hypothetical protein
MNEAIFAACEETWGDIPRFLTTAFVARDVESIREALGEDELTGFMISYGTGIGQTYAQMFPDRVGRLVLDGCEFVLDHREKWGFGETSLDNVTAAFEDGFVGECVKAGPAGCALATSASIEEADYKKAQAALSSRIHNLFDEIKRRPAPGFTHQAGPGIVTYERLIGMLYQSLYDPGSWGKTAEVFKELEAGNATLALQAMNAGWSYDPELAPSKGKQGPYPGHYSLTHPSSSELSRLVICVSFQIIVQMKVLVLISIANFREMRMTAKTSRSNGGQTFIPRWSTRVSYPAPLDYTLRCLAGTSSGNQRKSIGETLLLV